MLHGAAATLSVWQRSLSRRWDLQRRDRPEWKQQVLSDFNVWLTDLPDEPPEAADLSPEACDLYTLLMEFTALRQEIRLQNREQHRSISDVRELIEQCAKAADLFRDRTEQLPLLEERIRCSAEKKVILPFLDVREALVRGLEAARGVARRKNLFTRMPAGIEGVIEGYEMALRRFDRVLSQVDVRPLEAVGRPFDAAVMRAVDRRWDADRAAGLVLEELRSGFMRKDEVLRIAEVVVNTPQPITENGNNTPAPQG